MSRPQWGEPRPITPTRADLGESPVWDARDERLYWVDLPAGIRYATDLETGETTARDGRAPCGFIALAESGTLIGDGTQVVLESPEAMVLIADTTPASIDASGLRLNDSQVAPGGFLMAGLMETERDRRPGGRGRLVRISPGGAVDIVSTGIDLPNGMGWSPDSTTMYHVDMGRRRVDSYAYDPSTGIARDRHQMIDLADVPGLPDGMCVDAHGRLWIACYGTPTVRCFEPDGGAVAVIEFPVSSVTSCTFGGSDLDHLVVTTTSRGATPHPALSGMTFAVPTDTRGLPASVFPR